MFYLSHYMLFQVETLTIGVSMRRQRRRRQRRRRLGTLTWLYHGRPQSGKSSFPIDFGTMQVNQTLLTLDISYTDIKNQSR